MGWWSGALGGGLVALALSGCAAPPPATRTAVPATQAPVTAPTAAATTGPAAATQTPSVATPLATATRPTPVAATGTPTTPPAAQPAPSPGLAPPAAAAALPGATPPQPTPSPAAGAAGRLTAIPIREGTRVQDTPITPPQDAALARLGEDARGDLASRLGVSIDQVAVLEVRSVVWPDRGLGCPQPGMLYPQVTVDGLLIRLLVGGRTYQYHGGGGRAPFLCERPAAPPPGPPRRGD